MADAKRKLTIEILSDAKGVRQGFSEAEGAAGKFGGKVAKIGGAVAGAFAVSKIADFAGDTISSASDLNETVSKTGVIFGDATDGVLTFADGAAKSLGQSKKQALDAASSFALFGKSAGLTGKDLVGFSTDMVGLAGDMASFSNTTPDEAIEAIGAALRGESEPIRKYGVLLDDATLKARAMKLGIYDGTGALTQQQRVMAAQAEILAQTSSAQGDFARTSDGLANQQRITAAEFENLKAKIGEKLLPIMTALTKFVAEKLIPGLEVAAKWLSENFPKGIKAIQDAFDKVWPIIDNVVQQVEAVWKIIKGVFDVFADIFHGDWKKLWEDLGKIFEGVKDLITGVIGQFWEELKLLAKTAGKALLNAWLAGMQSVWDNILYPWFVGIPVKILEAVKDANLWLLGKGKDLILGFVHGLEDAWSDVFTWFFNLPVRIKDMFVDAAKWLVDVGRDLVKGIVAGIKAAPGAIRDALIDLVPGGASTVDKILKYIPFGGAFAEGGVVPGPKGAPRMILAHGGEFVASNAMLAGGAGGSGVTNYITINATDPDSVIAAIQRWTRQNGPIPVG